MNSDSGHRPLAERARPESLNDFVNLNRVEGLSQGLIHRIQSGQALPNLILWGPPGTGKTTLAKLIVAATKSFTEQVNAVETGAKALREIGQAAQHRKNVESKHTLLFVDEIHRFNKAQQDVLLPFCESGDLSLIGATTENPSYELNAALLSRSRLIVFQPHTEKSLRLILENLKQKKLLDVDQLLDEGAQKALIEYSHGDARFLISELERLNFEKQSEQEIEQGSKQGINDKSESIIQWPIDKDQMAELIQVAALRYDKTSDEHYDTISAFIKSIRGSDPDAGLYYLARMLKGGEDPVFIARRLVILASEDVGNADPRALTLATSGLQAVELVGMPEARITLAQVTTYLASAPKSNRSYVGLNRAMELVERTGPLAIPKALRSAKTKAMKEIGYGKGYKYSHDGPKGYADQIFLPEEIQNEKLYEPVERGFEKNIIQYLEWLKK